SDDPQRALSALLGLGDQSARKSHYPELTLGLTSARHGEGVTFVVEQLRQLLLENGVNVRVGGLAPAEPGEVVLLDASA
ncbi:hypothetical protein, partial [Klebsiella pneumoniae]|uniref:hypothetical protein n=1 Tax=Klebsiella pneumoniae TaxID=573 RepID=UPI00272FD466